MIRRAFAIAALSLCALPAIAQSGDGDMGSDRRAFAPRASAPIGYPAEYAGIVKAAEDEGQVVVFGATDADAVAPLIADFESMYPRIRVVYEDLNTTVLYHRFIAESRMRGDTADVLWSSAMDQMFSLASEGYAMVYRSPERTALPDWANWNDQAFATTYEPVVFAYNKEQIKETEVPQTHADFTRLLESDPGRFKGKVVMYDIEKSGIGFLLASQDAAAQQQQGFAAFAKALGRTSPTFLLTTSSMAEQVNSGRAVLGYNLLGGYVMAQGAKLPSLGYVLPRDYTQVISRVMIANKNAANPNAAKLWMDYVLSKRGQTVLATKSGLMAVRTDALAGTPAAQLRESLTPIQRPIAMNPTLLDNLSTQKYRAFVVEWRRNVFPERAR